MIRLLTPWPALLVETKERILVATDLHIGLEYELAKMGINIPFQTERILGELLELVRTHQPDRLLLLGDIKHGVPITSFLEKRELPQFFTTLQSEVENIDVVRGNHDANLQTLLPTEVSLHPSKGVILGENYKVAASHGHAWPYPQLLSADLILMGHNHPIVLLKTPLGIRVSQRVWIKGRGCGESLASAFLKQSGIEKEGDPRETFREQYNQIVTDPQIVLLPAFNDLLGGLPFNAEAPKTLLGPLLRTGAIKIDNFEAYLLDGAFLGNIEFLRTLS